MTTQPTLLLALALAAGLAACDRRGQCPDLRHNPTGKGTPVVTFGGDSITAEQLQERLMEMSPQARARYQTLEQRKEYVEGLARFELLAAEAVRRGLQNDPDVVGAAKKVMVQKLIQAEAEEQMKAVSDADLADYYQKHLTDYVRPELIRLGHVFVAAESPAEKTRRRPDAERLLEKARALAPQDLAAFGKLARESSEDPRTRPLGGDLRYLSADELKTQYGPQVAEAAEALRKTGDLSGLVETDRGFHFLKLQGRQSALELGLEEVKPQLRSRLLYEHRARGQERLLEELKRRASYQVNEQALAELKIDLPAPGQPPGGPSPPPSRATGDAH